MSTDTPSEDVLKRARRYELGDYERRVRRRVGRAGIVVCVVLTIVGLNILVNGPYNPWTITIMALIGFIIVTWAYMWTRRVGGGIYLFESGFVDAAGLRLIVVSWTEIKSIRCDMTSYGLGPLPVGTTIEYVIKYRRPDRSFDEQWSLNSTYDGVTRLTMLIAERAEVEITGAVDPRRYL